MILAIAYASFTIYDFTIGIENMLSQTVRLLALLAIPG